METLKKQSKRMKIIISINKYIIQFNYITNLQKVNIISKTFFIIFVSSAVKG